MAGNFILAVAIYICGLRILRKISLEEVHHNGKD